MLNVKNALNFIEYFGLPGCGKTTLLKSWSSRNKFRCYYTNGNKLSLDESFIKWNSKKKYCQKKTVILVYQSIKLMVKYKLIFSSIQFLKAASILSLNIGMWNGNKRTTNVIVLNDNGYAQLIVSILKRNDIKEYENFIRDFLNIFFDCTYPYCFCFLNVGPKICFERIIRRGKKLSITVGGVDTLKELYREKQLFECVEKVLSEYFKNNQFVTIVRKDYAQ